MGCEHADRHLPTEIVHEFTPNPWEKANATDDTICMAMLQTGIPEVHGFSHHAQCGHPRRDHAPHETDDNCGDD